jgi:hypothetical protein
VTLKSDKKESAFSFAISAIFFAFAAFLLSRHSLILRKIHIITLSKTIHGFGNKSRVVVYRINCD